MSLKKVATGVGASLGAGVVGLAVHNLVQKEHSLLRNFPVVGYGRYFLESMRAPMQQYFVERDWDGRPFDRNTRSMIYQRAKGVKSVEPFGTERDVQRVGHEYLTHSLAPVPVPDEPVRVMVGGADCRKPYSMSLLNISAMSYGSLSSNAVRAMNRGAKLGGFAHDTGEGGLTEHHLREGGDLIWQLGTGYFGARTPDGEFNAAMFAEKAQHDHVKCINLKLSQGAKPGVGGVLPGEKVTEEIAAIRGVPVGKTVYSPSAHSTFSNPIEMIEFIAHLRELTGGKPVGIKLCVGTPREFLSICKAMLEVGTAPDFIQVDGAEGGTGAAPLEFTDSVGMPLTRGLMTIHNALVGCGLRDQIKICASGKVASGTDIIKRIIQGADFTTSARAMMMATGCIQAQECHTGHCPVGVATQNPRLARALDVGDKSLRVQRYHEATVKQATKIAAAMGTTNPHSLSRVQLRHNISSTQNRSYEELYDWLEPGELLNDAPEEWAIEWNAAQATSFTPALS